jgi:uncharacterized protein (TIGR00270 family)
MCGAEDELFLANIEDAEMTVCRGCGQYGEIISRVREEEPESSPTREVKEEESEPEVITTIVSDYAERIKQKREKMHLKQEQLAKHVGEKVSVISHLERGKREPSIALAEKIESFLNISLVEEYEEQVETRQSGSSEGLTIGDMIQIS